MEFYARETQNLHAEKIEWKGVKQINNIEYTQNHTPQSTTTSTEVRVWQYWQIGPGKVYRWSSFGQTVQKISPLNVFHSTNVSINWITDSYEKAGSISINFSEKVIYCLLDKHQLNASYFNDNSSSSNASISGEEETEDESNSKDIEENEQHSFDCLVDGCTAHYHLSFKFTFVII